MKTFKNTGWTKRNYECTNVVACQGTTAPKNGTWVECDASVIVGLTPLWIEGGIRFFGYM